MIVIGASAGGLAALRDVVGGFPAGLRAAIFVVMHLAPERPSLLPQILGRSGELPAVHPVDCEQIVKGRIYVAPPDRHMVLADGVIRLSLSPKENRFRPSIDLLFRSAAAAYGERVAGVVLSGSLGDGAAGLAAIKEAGGVALVQDPEEAAFADMPLSALDAVAIDRKLRAAQIGRIIPEIVDDAPDRIDTADAKPNNGQELQAVKGNPSLLTCPDCNGMLWEVRNGNLVQYRCRIGHGFSSDALETAQDEAIERAMWAALRALEESAALAERLAEQARQINQPFSGKRFAAKASERKGYAATLRKLLETEPGIESATE